MSAIDGQTGTIATPELRPYGELKRGYTYFGEGDVLFAKITPCMQNGKHAIARALTDGVGFGSTEFHVIRAEAEIIPEWTHFFIRQPCILQAATAYFYGAVGQQRVPEDYLATLDMPLPPLPEQRRIAAILTKQMENVERARAAAEAQRDASARVLPAQLSEIFDGPEAEAWPTSRLGDLLIPRREIVHPSDNPSGPATFVGLEHVESTTGHRIGSLSLEMSELTGRKPRFAKGDIVYGYLRPYLNKVWLAEFDGLCSVDQFAYQVRGDTLDAEYLAWFMRSPVYLRRSSVVTTTGQLPRIGVDEIAAVESPFPRKRDRHAIARRIRCCLEALALMRSGIEGTINAVRHLPAALLREAFTGRL
jgi:type I restriction enzyme S subunit